MQCLYIGYEGLCGAFTSVMRGCVVPLHLVMRECVVPFHRL